MINFTSVSALTRAEGNGNSFLCFFRFFQYHAQAGRLWPCIRTNKKKNHSNEENNISVSFITAFQFLPRFYWSLGDHDGSYKYSITVFFIRDNRNRNCNYTKLTTRPKLNYNLKLFSKYVYGLYFHRFIVIKHNSSNDNFSKLSRFFSCTIGWWSRYVLNTNIMHLYKYIYFY